MNSIKFFEGIPSIRMLAAGCHAIILRGRGDTALRVRHPRRVSAA